MAEQTETIVPLKEFHAFIVRCMCAVGVSEMDASSLAELLVSADYRGHYSHGLNRLGRFVYVLYVCVCMTLVILSLVKNTVCHSVKDQ